MTAPKQWRGGTPKCDFGDSCSMTPWFVDGKTNLGPWALMCSDHYLNHGLGLGTGLGQRYSSEPPYTKLEG